MGRRDTVVKCLIRLAFCRPSRVDLGVPLELLVQPVRGRDAGFFRDFADRHSVRQHIREIREKIPGPHRSRSNFSAWTGASALRPGLEFRAVIGEYGYMVIWFYGSMSAPEAQ